jgi:predicted NBD/HSP70 family sugar kinase
MTCRALGGGLLLADSTRGPPPHLFNTNVWLNIRVRLEDRVLAALTVTDGMTRAELVEALGLSATAVGPVVAALVESGRLHVERADGGSAAGGGRDGGGPGSRRRGRPTGLLRVPGPVGVVATVTASVAEPRVGVATMSGRRAWSAAVELPTGGPGAPLEAVVRAALDRAASCAEGPVRHVVLSVPAPFRFGVAEPFAMPASGPAYDTPIRDDPSPGLAAALGIPVSAENDANLAALGELDAGAGRGHSDLIHLLLDGDSLGAGLVLDGRLHRGAAGFGGEIAHIHVDDLGAPCACGSRGCLTGRLGQPMIEAVEAAWGVPVTWAGLLQLAESDDLRAQRVLVDLGRLIGRPLADLVTILNPGAVILDGRLGAAGRWVAAGIRDQIDRYTAPGAAATVGVVGGELPDAVAVGGARLVRTEALAALRTAGGGRAGSPSRSARAAD